MDLSFAHRIKENFNFDRFLTVFVLVDVCLFPYIRPIRCTTSMLLLLLWYGLRLYERRNDLNKFIKDLLKDREAVAFAVSCVCIMVSALVGLIVLPKTVPSNYQSGQVNVFSRTVTYSAIYIFVFLYYFFYREMVKKYPKLIYRIIKLVFIAIFVFSLVYLISPSGFYKIRPFWTLSGKPQNATTETSSYFRYTFSFSDPNNLAAMAVAMAILFLENKRENRLVKYSAFIMCAVILLGTMSVQGILGFGCYIGVKLLVFLYKVIKGQIKVQRRTVYICLAIFAVFLVSVPLLLQIPVIEKAVTRVLSNGGSFLTRWRIWTRLIQGKGILSYLIWGQGCAIVVDGVEIMPHNGHLYILYCYGMIAYVMFMFVFFWKKRGVRWNRMLFLIPLFVCFSINVGLLDARYSFCMALITAFGFRKMRRRRKMLKNTVNVYHDSSISDSSSY